MFDQPEIKFAVEAVREAALLARQVQRELVSTGLTKADKSPVTVADFASQALISQRLADCFPNSQLIGEESAAELRTGQGADLLPLITRFVRTRIPDASDEQVLDWIDRGAGSPPESFWTLDPVDGTKGFLRGDQYAVALALISGGEVQVGALGCPELDNAASTEGPKQGTLALAVRGKKTQWTCLSAPREWQELSVSTTSEVQDSRLLRSVESAHTNTGAIGQLIASLGIRGEAVPLDSQAKYCVLAAGKGDVLLRLLSSSRPDYREKIWDQAAGSIIVEQAGGRVTDLDGKALDFSQGRTLAYNRGVLATNGHLHDRFLAALKELGV